MSEGIVDGSARDAAWYALHSADTDAARLARIAEVYPEFAPQIAVHPNAYPELVAWAASYGPSAPAAPDSNPPAAAGSVVAASGIPGQPGNAAQPGYPSAAHPVLARPPRNTGLWFFAFLFVAAGPIAASMIALNLPLSLDGTFPDYAFLHAVGPLAMLIPILVSAPAGGKPLAGALLGTGDADGALAAYARARRGAPPEALAGLELGEAEAHRARGDTDAALAIYRRILGDALADAGVGAAALERLEAID